MTLYECVYKINEFELEISYFLLEIFTLPLGEYDLDFSFRNTKSPLNGTRAVSQMVEECKEEFSQPDLMNAQHFRRYMATVSQVSDWLPIVLY